MYKDIYKKVAESLDLSPSYVEKVYKSFWKYIKTSIEALPMKENLTDEEFSKLRTNFNILFLGKLYCNADRYRNIKNRYNRVEQYIKNKDVKD